MAPFTALSGLPKKAKIDWTNGLDLAFKRVKAIIVQGVLMIFPNHNKDFDIYMYTDSSDYQLGSCIMQDGKQVAYYSKRLTDAQKTTQSWKKELLSIVMTLREFRSMLLGANINIFADQRNLNFSNFSTQCVLHTLEVLRRRVCSKIILSTRQTKCTGRCIFTFTKIRLT